MLLTLKNLFIPPIVSSKEDLIKYLVWVEKRTILVTFLFNLLSIVSSFSEGNYYLFYSNIIYSLAVITVYYLLKIFNEKYYVLATYIYFSFGLLSLNFNVFVAPEKTITMIVWLPGMWMALFFFVMNLRMKKIDSYIMVSLTLFTSFFLAYKFPQSLHNVDLDKLRIETVFSMIVCLIWMTLFLVSRIIVLNKLFIKMEEEKNASLTLNRVISHDLSNSIFIISNSITSIKKRPDKTDYYVDKINSSTIQIKNIITSAKNITLLGTDKEVNEYEIQNIHNIIQECLLFLEDKIKSKQLKIETNLIDKSLYVEHINPVILKYNIFTNILTNAIKFTPANGTIEVRAVAEDENYIKIEFIDSGIGIPNNLINKIFSFDDSTSRNGTNGEVGTGLGLPIVKNIILKLNGRISVESQVGFGTNFIITLPKNNIINLRKAN